MSTACSINRPPEYDSSAVASICATGDGETVGVSYMGQTKQVTVDWVPSWGELYELCGETAGACVDLATNVIHMVDNRRCLQSASHELGHIFGVAGLDVPRQIALRRQKNYNM
jgi:hypothetical protein